MKKPSKKPCRHRSREVVGFDLQYEIEWCPDCGAIKEPHPDNKFGSDRMRWVNPRGKYLLERGR